MQRRFLLSIFLILISQGVSCTTRFANSRFSFLIVYQVEQQLPSDCQPVQEYYLFHVGPVFGHNVLRLFALLQFALMFLDVELRLPQNLQTNTLTLFSLSHNTPLHSDLSLKTNHPSELLIETLL